MDGSKAIVIADLHLHHLPNWRLDWCSEFVDQILDTEWPQVGDLVHLYLLGDVLEIKDKVDARVANLLIKLVTRWRHGDVVWLSGQHDSYIPGKATFHELDKRPLRSGRVYVVDCNTLHLHGYYFVPYQRRDSDYRALLAEVPEGSIVLTHMPIVEVLGQFGRQLAKGISMQDFKRFKQVYSGDIHKYNELGNVSYIGAPSQRDWRDEGVVGVIGQLRNGILKRSKTKHPIHLKVESEAQIPNDDNKYVVSFVEGGTTTKGNVISSISKIGVDIKESLHLLNPGSVGLEEQVKTYLDKNKPKQNSQEYLDFAMKILKKVQAE